MIQQSSVPLLVSRYYLWLSNHQWRSLTFFFAFAINRYTFVLSTIFCRLKITSTQPKTVLIFNRNPSDLVLLTKVQKTLKKFSEFKYNFLNCFLLLSTAVIVQYLPILKVLFAIVHRLSRTLTARW
jgi:hypothetical protein